MKPEPNENSMVVDDEAGVKEEFDESEGPEDHSIDGEDSDEEDVPKARKTKRARSSVANPKASRKKYVRGKQGGLEGMMKMPLEIFTEIAYHITPGDLIALIRCSKFFRNMLLRRSAILIWHRAAENVSGLPPCPTKMCEPQYAALMFSKHCTLCGATATAKPDPYLQVRLCSACRDTQLEGWNQGSSRDYAAFLFRSEVSKPKTTGGGRKTRNAGAQYYALVSEVHEVREKCEELRRSKDRSDYSSWVGERQRAIRLRVKEASTLQLYVDSMSKSHDEELADARKQRRETIHSRLKELGWTNADLSFEPGHAKPWNALVETSKPLTDRIWTNIRPKLISLLEENRARRLENNRVERRIQRRKRLHRLLLKMKRTEHPFAAAHSAIKPKPKTEKPIALDSDLSGDSGTDSGQPDKVRFLSDGWGMKRQRAVVPNPFPQTAIALEWECLKDLGETEISLEEVEELFNERQEQIRQGVADWRTGFERRLAEVHEAGAEGAALGAAPQTPEGEGTNVEPIVKVKGSTDTTKDLSPDVRFLLRADTIFKKGPLDENEPLYAFKRAQEPAIPHLRYYPNIISSSCLFLEHSGWPRSPVEEMNVEKYDRYTEAEKLVKAMLAGMQMPDVARMELDAMKSRFACGRCTERKSRKWNELVLHYMEQQKRWEKDSAKTGSHPTRHPVTFRNPHDVECTTNPKSLVRILTVEEASQMNIVPLTISDRVRCRLCDGTGRYYTGSLDDARVHLQDVHDIADPTEGLHYQNGQARSPLSDIIGDEWHKEWDAFHDAQAVTAVPATAPSSTSGS